MQSVRRSKQYVFLAFFVWITALPAQAALIYQTDSIFDSATRLLWQSTGVTQGLPGAQLSDDRIVGDGWRLATGAEVTALFTGNFPELTAVLNTTTPVAIVPGVQALILGLGGIAADLVIEADGVEVLRWPTVLAAGWAAAPAVPTSIGQTQVWGYQKFTIGYGVHLDTFPDPTPESVFQSLSPIGSFRELAISGNGADIGEVGDFGYFLVRAVPAPGTALLLLAGFPAVFWASRRRLSTLNPA